MQLLVCVLYILTVTQISYQLDVKYVESFIKFTQEGIKHIESRPQNKDIPLSEYDFIIVGAGTAGCTIANRLTENVNWNVLLLEAGGPENYLNSIPLLVNYLQFTSANWNHKTVPSNSSCLGLKNNQSNWAAGKGLGGTSALNYMINTRGNRKDYDTWESFGNPGWGYDDILKYFKKLESFNIPQYKHDRKHHGSNGPVPVSYAPYRTQISEAIIQAAKDMGHQILDYNGASQIGYSYLQAHLNNGTRASASVSYLHPISHRKNLHVRRYSIVDKIIINPNTKRAYGVQFRSKGRTYKVKARKEVILSAGAINSPKLLMLSGIGPEEHLRELKISVLSNLKVGHNLMDHVTMGGLTFLIDKPYSIRSDKLLKKRVLLDYFLKHQGPLTTLGGCEVIAFYDLDKSNDRNGHPNLELLFQGGSLVSDPLLPKNFGIRDDIYDAVFKPIQNKESFMVWPILLRPKSKGRVMLKDSNPDSEPLLYHNYFEDEDDLRVVVDGVEKILELMKHPALKEMGTRLHNIPIPGCEHLRFASRKYWECQTRYLTFTLWHVSGTAKMGPASDKSAVVDPTLKVYGIKNLRVIDASVMVTVPAAHTNTPTYMVAEKGADLIKEDWGFPTD